MKHANVSIFVPHNGCPHSCSFCNQVRITGQQSQPTAEDVIQAVETAMKSRNYHPKKSEIAFFGGSFTAIRKEYMILLLESAYPYVHNGSFSGIRISTRPDCINDEVLVLLKSYGVKSIELGTQSMSNDVLQANRRGHTAEDVEKAALQIKSYGFELGMQMMTGLYKSTVEKDYDTALKICQIKPKTVRIYPTIIMKDTLLADYYQQGIYRTYTLEETVDLCAELLELFQKSGIDVIRIGLHSTQDIEEGMLAGAWHPSFGELCFSRLYRNRIEKYLRENSFEKGNYQIYVYPTEISKVTGQKKGNRIYFQERGYLFRVKADNGIEQGSFRLEFLGV